jgi:iron complex outermembrane recepter protein
VLGLAVLWAPRAVTSPAKKTQSSNDVPSAIYVIRGDDLRRSGATSVPEALRAVPGLQVARTNANTWAISARGFNDNFSNKLLVLIDGRSVYSPLHSGVYWDVQDLLLEDVDRIEVIRGPGGTLWGANAVNGIINIITKRSEESQGVVASGAAGTEERAMAGVRYGFKLTPAAGVRVYAKYFDRDDAADGVDPDREAHDGWSMGRTGFRADWNRTARDRVTFSGDYYGGSARWIRRAASPSSFTSIRRPARGRCTAKSFGPGTWTPSIDSDPKPGTTSSAGSGIGTFEAISTAAS